MIVFQNVSKVYPLGNVALDNVSFTIEDGEFVFLVGPSGAGKTSILNLLLCRINLSKGGVFVDAQEISSPKFRGVKNLRRRIGVVFQDFKVLNEFNVFENLAIALKITGADSTFIEREIEQTLDLVGIPDKMHLFPTQLSAGELQRVAIARAIIGSRDIILADEPTGNLDPKTTWEIMRVFKNISKNRTVLFATHNTDIVNSLKKRVLVMENGKLIKDIKKGGYDVL